MDETSLAIFVRRRARQLGLSQDAIARRAGVSRQGLVKLLSGDTQSPRVDTVRRLAGALSVSPIYLFQLLFERNLFEHPLVRQYSAVSDHSFFVEDVTIPNGLIVTPGNRFQKIWRIQNGGSVSWLNRRLSCVSDEGEGRSPLVLCPMQTVIDIPDTVPGAVVDLAMWFTAPNLPGTCISQWKMIDASGGVVFPHLEPLNCVVVVSST